MTNIVLGLLSLLVLRAQSLISQLIFWGVNLGLAVFVVGLVVESAEIKHIGAPLMGVTLLFALAVLAWQAWSGTLDEKAAAA
ncbi:MAG: hypothetical protein ACSLFN_01490 [Candidatus Limnocylindrales bacterium]